MIISAKVLLDRFPDPSEAAIREALAGNFCRCTGYTKIVESIGAAARTLQEVEPHEQEPVAPMVRRNPPKLQSSFAKASEDTRVPPRSGDLGILRRQVK